MSYRQYRAAGILPFATHNGRVLLLLGSEPRRRSEATPGKHGNVWWLAFGGKVEPHDQGVAQRTALREYNEESGHCLGAPRLIGRPMWDARAKYVLFPAEIPYQAELPRFSDADAEKDDTLNKRELRWLEAEPALQGLNPQGIQHGSDFLPIKPWFSQFLYRERVPLQRLVEQMQESVEANQQTMRQ